MFTGIIEGIGKVQSLEKLKSSIRIWIEPPFSLSKEKLGDSIAVSGCCLTITGKRGKSFAADVSPETLSRTSLSDLKIGSLVNVERALKFGDRLGGHIVQGHVDGVVKLISRKELRSKKGKYLVLSFEIARNLRPYLVEKGSVTLDGISLTVNEVQARSFSVCIIPHTQDLTTLTGKKTGDIVNIEVDILAKYLEQLFVKK